jgi:hypothetical protein
MGDTGHKGTNGSQAFDAALFFFKGFDLRQIIERQAYVST